MAVDKALEAAKAAGATHRDVLDQNTFYRYTGYGTQEAVYRDGVMGDWQRHGDFFPPKSAKRI